MGSRIRRDVKHIFDCFLEVAKPVSDDADPFILQSFPTDYKNKEADKLQQVPLFTFPCPLEITTVQHFSFVLTDMEASWTYGFCRVAPNAQTALVFLSKLPWHEAFYKMLNHAAELITYHSQDELFSFLHASHICKVPENGQMFHVSWLTDKNVMSDFAVETPHQLNLPTLPENRNMNEYFNAVKPNEMMTIFASLLHERRIVVTSSRLSRLTACVQAVNTLMYPMSWQHIFIPVLHKKLVDYLSAPMPFLIGVPLPLMKRVKSHELGEAVIVNADSGIVNTPFDDLSSLPIEVKETLQKGLKSKNLLGDVVARTHLSALVHLIGGYRDALKLRQGEKITFDENSFINSRPGHMAPFLRQMLELQLFRQFVEERLTLLNSGKSVSDEFEREVLRYAERSPHSAKLRSQAAQLKREGGAFVKAVQKKANPAVKSAVRSVRESSKNVQTLGKTALKDFKAKRNGSQLRYNGEEDDDSTRSAPSSPTNPRMTIRYDGTLPSGLVRNNTELNFSSKVLKYEKFEPPPVSSLSSHNLCKSPTDFESPLQDLNLDLMTEMQDIINKKPSPFHQPPKVNRQLKPPLKRTSQIVEPVIKNQTELQVASKPLLVEHVLVNDSCDVGDSPELDLIALGGTETPEDIIFDPLLEKPPDQQPPTSLHRPLQRTSLTVPQPPQIPKFSNSSEDLLLEYGLDFNKLSIPKPPSMLPQVPPPKPQIPNNNFDPFSPLITPNIHPAAPPVAPPRTKRSTQNWTTFD